MDASELERDHVEEEEGNHHARHHDPSGYNDEEDDRSHPFTGDGASLGKIFVGGLARETTTDQFVSHFERYGEITDSVIMKDRTTGHPRGFGFITYADSSVVDRVIEDTHIINGKQVEIKRTIPKGVKSRDFKTKKIFVGGIPTTVTEEEFKEFFSEFGDVKEHQIMRDHNTNRSRGFGFITFVKDEHVDNLLSRGNRIDFAGVQVEIKKAEPRKPNALPSLRRYNDTRSTYGGGFRDSYGGYGGDSGGFGPSSYRAGGGAYGGRSAAAAAVGYGGFGGGGFGAYGAYGASMMGGPYRGAVASSYGYMNRYGAGGYGRGSYDMGSGGGYGAASGDGYGSYGAAMGGSGAFGGGYDSGLGGGYGGGGGPMYGSSRGGAYGGAGAGGAGSGRYHPYGR